MALNFLKSWGDRLGFSGSRPPGEGAYIYILLFATGWMLADFGTTFVRGNMLPVGGITQTKNFAPAKIKAPPASLISAIESRNIFNSDHVIPDSKGLSQTGGGVQDAKPVKTSLPLELVGTIIHGRRELSVATIQVRGKDILAVMEGENLEALAKIFDIQRFKVIFRNMSNSRMEFVEIEEDDKLNIGLVSPPSGAQTAQPEKTNFSFKREEINKYLDDLPRVLQDAKAVPYMPPGSSVIAGFKLVAIKPGSIYEKLGLKRGDIIKGVNGEEVTDVQKAMEMYQAMKSSANEISLDIERDGSVKTINYNLE